MPRSTPDRVCRVSSRLFTSAVTHCSATLRVCHIMYRPKEFCAWHATSKMEFHPSQTGADHGAVLPSPGCTRFVQTVVCPLETPSTALRIELYGESTLRPPRPRVDDDLKTESFNIACQERNE